VISLYFDLVEIIAKMSLTPSHFSLYFVLGSEDKLELFLFSHTQIYSVLAAFLLLIFYSTLFRTPPI
ncbi:hypothetical protein QG055_10250, partial [Kingella kingae]|uniref:hypothetical protein n=1 Tax=Kingella kingae TaxID=504 RepID=UPI0025502D9C